MGAELNYNIYHKKCNDKDIIPYLDCDYDDSARYRWINCKNLDENFFNLLREYGTEYEIGSCFVLECTPKIFELASKTEFPTAISDFITDNYNEDMVIIIWKR